jgi:hypothetical protein
VTPPVFTGGYRLLRRRSGGPAFASGLFWRYDRGVKLAKFLLKGWLIKKFGLKLAVGALLVLLMIGLFILGLVVFYSI